MSKEAVTRETPSGKIDEVLQDYIWASVGIGAVPLPFVDLAGLIGIQLKMIKKITDLYGVSFSREAVKRILISLSGYSLLANIGPIAMSALKSIPLIGQAVGSIAMPALCGASTYATAKVLVMHFESGGTIFSFDSEKMKDHYKKMFAEGQKFSENLEKEKTEKKNN